MTIRYQDAQEKPVLPPHPESEAPPAFRPPAAEDAAKEEKIFSGLGAWHLGQVKS